MIFLYKKKNKLIVSNFPNLEKNFTAPFLWMGFNCLKATEPLRGDSLLFTIQFSGVPGTQLIDLGRMKG